jgi:peptide/nickel transport system substrate-binding protein
MDRSVYIRTLVVLLIGTVMTAALAACGSSDTVIEKVVETVIVEKVVTEKGDTERVVETVIVEKVVTEKGDTVVQTVIVEKPVVQTVVVEKLVVASMVPVGKEPRYGGTLRWTLHEDVATLDVLVTTSQPRIGALHSQERLFDFDEDLAPHPTLVDSWQTSSDGLTWTFKLREGLTFNGPVEGRPVTSTHAMESWKRWMVQDNFGVLLSEFIESIETPDDLTFVVKVNESTGLLLDGLARLGGHEPFVMPPEMYDVDPAEGPGSGEMDTFGGTGPYQLVSWRPGDKLVFTKWDGYKPSSGPTSFHSGTKHAYADVLEAIVVPEEASRIAALLTGQVDFIGRISGDSRAQLEANPDVSVHVDMTSALRIGTWPNHVKGPMSDARVRRAVMMAYPNEDALLANTGSPDLYRVCASLMICGTRWGGLRTPGDEFYYDPPDIEGAKALIEEAGFTGASVTLLTRGGAAKEALVTREVLVDLGFDVEYLNVDSATYKERRADPDKFDLFHTGGPVSWGGISPLLNSSLSKMGYHNKYQDPSGKFTEMLSEFARAPRERQDELVEEMQILFFKDLQYLPIGEVLPLIAQSKSLHGVEERLEAGHPSFVNAWKDR